MYKRIQLSSILQYFFLYSQSLSPHVSRLFAPVVAEITPDGDLFELELNNLWDDLCSRTICKSTMEWHYPSSDNQDRILLSVPRKTHWLSRHVWSVRLPQLSPNCLPFCVKLKTNKQDESFGRCISLSFPCMCEYPHCSLSYWQLGWETDAMQGITAVDVSAVVGGTRLIACSSIVLNLCGVAFS